MTEHKLITFQKQDVIEALEDFYKKTKGETIDINFDAKALEYSNIREIVVKVVSMNTEGIKAELEPKEHLIMGENISKGLAYLPSFTTYHT